MRQQQQQMRMPHHGSGKPLNQQAPAGGNRTQFQMRLYQQHRDRLLQQQQKQQMVVPVNATVGADQLCKWPN